MSRQGSEVLYTYPWVEKVGLYAGVLLWASATLCLTLLSIRGLVEFLSQAMSGMADLRVVAALILLPTVPGLGLLVFSNTYPSLRISDGGITVQVFLFWWVFVPWRDVEEIRTVWFSRSRLVLVRRLTPVHRLIGSGNIWKLKPAFLIRRTLIGYDEAVKTIEKNVDGSL